MASSDEWFEGEPSLAELLADPMTSALMAVDKVTEADVRAVLDAARARPRAIPVPDLAPA